MSKHPTINGREWLKWVSANMPDPRKWIRKQRNQIRNKSYNDQ